MDVAKYDMTVVQGSDYQQQLNYGLTANTSLDLLLHTARMQFRSESGALALELTETDGIILGDAYPNIALAFTKEKTTPMLAKAGRYDLELTDADGNTLRILEGRWTLSPEITL